MFLEETSSDLAFTVRTHVFRRLLDRASRVVPTKDIVPILKNFLVSVRDGVLTVSATDLELSVVSRTEYVLEIVPGTGVVPAKKLLDIVKSLSDDIDIEIFISNGELRVEADGSSWSVRLPIDSEYPSIPSSSVASTPVDRARFLHSIRSVWHAASKDLSRSNLMFIHIDKGKVTSCDGVRFQQSYLGDCDLSIQIPIGAVEDLISLLRDSTSSEVFVGQTDTHLLFSIGDDLFAANKAVESFPDIETVILRPSLENNRMLRVSREDLSTAIDRVRINADEDTHAIGIRLSNNSMTLEAKDKVGSTAFHGPIEAEWGYGDRLLVVNYRFLIDMLQACTSSTCEFYLGDDSKRRKFPVLLKDEESSTVGVVQQMSSSLIL